jgi:hypothetical protein
LPQPDFELERAAEMVFHAYKYVRGLDRSGADLLWSMYRELEQKQRQHEK